MSEHLFKSSLFSFDEEVVSLLIMLKLLELFSRWSQCLLKLQLDAWNLDGSVLQSR